MAVTGQYASYTTASPTKVPEMLVQMQTRVLMGLEDYDTALNAAGSEGERIGFAASKSFDLGILSSVGIEINSELEEFEAANVSSSGIFTLSNEEAIVSMGVTQFDYRLLEIALANGTMTPKTDAGPPAYTEAIWTVGGSCSTISRPIVIEAENIACFAPTGDTDVDTGVQGIVITVYDAQCTSGLPWSDILAGEINTLELEFTAKAIDAHSAGNKLLSIYMF